MKENSQHPGITDTKHHARYALMTLYFFSGFVFATLFSRLPTLQQIYHFDFAHLGLMQFCMSIGSLLFMPICANLSNKYGSNLLTRMGYLTALLFLFLPIMPKGSHLPLFALCMVYGAVSSIFDIAINGNSILVEASYKKAILSKFHAIYYVGTCLGALLSIFFISLNIDLSIHFSVVSILVFCELSIVRPFLLHERPKQEEGTHGFHFLFPRGLILLLAFVALFSRVIEGVVSSWSSTFMNNVVELPYNLAPIALATYAAFMAIGRFAGDEIRKRYASPYIVMVCSVVTAIGLLIMVAGTGKGFLNWVGVEGGSMFPTGISLLGFLITGLGMSCLVPVIYSMAGSQPGVSPGTGIAMVNTISGTGFLFGPVLIGLIASATSLHVSFVYVLCLAVTMSLLANRLWHKTGKATHK